MENLPQDIIFNILSRVPVKTLLRVRSLSKFWSDIINNPFLANLHLKRATEDPSLLLFIRPDDNRKVIGIHSVTEGNGIIKPSMNAITQITDNHQYHLANTCNGFLCFASNDRNNGVFLCNPYRDEVINLPPITMDHLPRTSTVIYSFDTYGLGFNPSTMEYKVVGVFYQVLDLNNKFMKLEAKIHTIGTKLWREIRAFPAYPVCKKPVYANGALHWKIYHFFAPDNTENFILTFDIEKEKSSLRPHPGFGSKNGRMEIIELRGCLSIVDLSFNTHIEIWVLKDHVKNRWVKEYNIVMKVPDSRDIQVIGLWEDGEILLRFCYHTFFSYDPKSDRLRYIHIPRSKIYHHIASLESLKAYDNWTGIGEKGAQ